MKACLPSTRVLILVLGCGVLGGHGMSAAGAERKSGEKVEFSKPSTSRPSVRPLTERDLDEQRFSFQRRLDPAGDLPSGSAMPLSGPEQSTRAQALRALVELSSAMNSDGLWENEMGDEASQEPGDTRLSIDDLFDRRMSSTDEAGRRRDNGGEFDRSQDDFRSRREGLDEDGGRRETDGPADRNSSRNGANREDTRNEPFVPTLSLGSTRSDWSLPSDRSRGGDNFLSPDRRTGSWLLDRNRLDDERRGREERMESFRKLLNSPSGGGGVADFLGRNGLGAVGGGTVVGLPGTSIPDARRGPAVGVPAIGAPAPASDPLGSSRNLALPARSVELDLSVGQNRPRSLGDLSPLPTTAPRPMELFRQKHDARMPGRVF